MVDEIDERYQQESFYVSSRSEDTDAEWQYILELCRRRYAIGFSALDSFLSGPDLETRVRLVEAEALKNEWLTSELRDALSLDQSKDWSSEQEMRMKRAARLAQ
jgi:hypothetical protein